MGLLNSITGKSKVKAGNKKVLAARENKDAAKAEALLSEAMLAYGQVASDSSAFKDALYNWGMALLYSARLKQGGEGAKGLYEEAGKKFSYCLVAKEDYMASALDWGVALMELAALQEEAEKAPTYVLAKEKFTLADSIQSGVASYNFACLHAIAGDFEACKAALELAHEYRNLPDEDDILNDADMQVAKTQAWFTEFLAAVNAPESEEKPKESDEEKAEEDVKYSDTKIVTDGYKVEYDKKSE
ncbi:MAG: hypothetical protein GQ582_11935 [Methyloprofundus sp.]|nr:hypothetical protein [Methyloprofundus sp.]